MTKAPQDVRLTVPSREHASLAMCYDTELALQQVEAPRGPQRRPRPPRRQLTEPRALPPAHHSILGRRRKVPTAACGETLTD